jgi:preprotein translocase subunit SecG
VLFAAEVSTLSHLINVLIIFVSLLLMLTILIQKGKGGGLIGAFGGAGGSSAFGSKAGDAFTRITLIMAAVWVVLIMVQVRVTNANTPKSVDNTAISTPE